ncbi:MAG: PilZ domain-containing protein [Nitrospira sp.]|nr:PilZ domain-containing protein [Nitrospira sp.]
MKTYTVRKKLRTSARCQLCYFCDGSLTTGIVWDLSEGGWRAAGERPVHAGTESTVYMTILEGDQPHNILIDAAVVRWSDGQIAGWEILRIDEANRTRLTHFVENLRSASPTEEILTGSRS